MKPKTIKFIDYWLGMPLTVFLTLFRYIGSFFVSKRVIVPQKILFIKLIEQGATVLAIPSIEKAIEIAGASNVYFIVFSDNRPILNVINLIPPQNIIEIDQRSFFGFITNTVRAIIKIRKLRIDTTIDMEFFSRFTAAFAFFTGAENRIGYHRYTSELPVRGDLMTHKIQYNPYLHISKAYYLLAESILLDPVSIPFPKINVDFPDIKIPKITPSENSINKIKEILSAKGIDFKSNRIVILNPNAGDMLPLRKWQDSNYICLAEKILSEYPNIVIVFTGNHTEKIKVESLCNSIKSERAVSLAGETDMSDLFALYHISHLLITNDSGPAHFATLTDINIITLFGPETPVLFSPLSDRAVNIRMNISCSPCVSILNHRFSPCNNNVCMQLISVENVFNTVANIF